MVTIEAKNDRTRAKLVKKIIESVGNQIGSVYFRKRSDDKKRRMSFRLHVTRPSYAPVPQNKKARNRKAIENKNLMLTVFDTNKIRYNNKGNMCGRGDYRTIPLDRVERICVNGTIYKVLS